MQTAAISVTIAAGLLLGGAGGLGVALAAADTEQRSDSAGADAGPRTDDKQADRPDGSEPKADGQSRPDGKAEGDDPGRPDKPRPDKPDKPEQPNPDKPDKPDEPGRPWGWKPGSHGHGPPSHDHSSKPKRPGHGPGKGHDWPGDWPWKPDGPCEDPGDNPGNPGNPGKPPPTSPAPPTSPIPPISGGGGSGNGGFPSPPLTPQVPGEPTPSEPGVLAAAGGGLAPAIGLPGALAPISPPVMIMPRVGGSPSRAAPPVAEPPAPAPARPVAPQRPAGIAPAPASTPTLSGMPASFRAGYPEYLRSARLTEVAGLALPGVAGIVALTALGGLVGFRQAKAGHAVRSAGTARFLQ